MTSFTVADIKLKAIDKSGLSIEAIYHVADETYAIYANQARLAIQYADDPKLATEQRLALAHLAPLRGEIHGLIDGWRNGLDTLFGSWRRDKLKARARRYDRRTADALVVALQGDQASAEVLLQGIKAEILDERMSTGRAEYVVFAAIAASIVFILLGGLHLSGFPAFIAKYEIWKASTLGCLGAFFSIATMTSNRTVRSDLKLRDNFIDAFLRILIGAISAIVLFSLFRSKIVTLEVGAASTANIEPYFLVVVGFLAGFSERLVGDLLTNQVEARLTTATSNRTQASVAAETAGAAEAKASVNERNPLGKATVEASVYGEPEATDRHEHDDTCLCDSGWDEDEATDDIELPEATGGVESKQAA
ncbi:hypothetical protein [Rhizobium sp. PP-CC-3G-465]|uniref:hypothetical protein n=1 Tax=Rhizobium sp. PP-CC-3G-465 TaxID=2135648 RepID=UPI00104FD224|nr:hypothetical protein C8J33_11628 [Rhizobium sp. PP-CC-3G-465]